MARLALDANAVIDFSVPFWHGLDSIAATPYFAAMGMQQISLGAVPAGQDGNDIEIITHPLWATDPANFGATLAAAYAQAQASGATVRFKSIFEILRRPY